MNGQCNLASCPQMSWVLPSLVRSLWRELAFGLQGTPQQQPSELLHDMDKLAELQKTHHDPLFASIKNLMAALKETEVIALFGALQVRGWPVPTIPAKSLEISEDSGQQAL